MNIKAQTLYALMENKGYSYGLISTATHLLSPSQAALDEMIIFLEDENPSEEQFVAHMAQVCEEAIR